MPDIFDTAPDVPINEDIFSNAPAVSLKRSYAAELEKDLQDARLYGSATTALSGAADKGIRRDPTTGNWDLPLMTQAPENPLLAAIAGPTVTIGQKLGARMDLAGPAVDKERIQGVFNNLMKKHDLTPEQVSEAWSDLGNKVRPWGEDERTRVISDGKIILNPASRNLLDTEAAMKDIEAAPTSEDRKREAREALRPLQTEEALRRMQGYEQSASVAKDALSSASRFQPLGAQVITTQAVPTVLPPSEWARQTGRSEFTSPEAVRDYEREVLDKEGTAHKWARGLATDFINGFMDYRNDILGLSGMAGNENAAQSAAEAVNAQTLGEPGKPATGITGMVTRQIPQIAAQVVTGRLFGALGALAPTEEAASAIANIGTVGMAGAQSAGLQYAQDRAEGKSHEKALDNSVRSGISTALITGIFQAAGPGGVEKVAAGKNLADVTLRDVLKAGTREELYAGVKSLTSDIAKSVAGEAGEEFSDQLAQSFLTADPDTNLADAWDQAVQAGMVGGIMGGGVDVMAKTFEGGREAEALLDGGESTVPLSQVEAKNELRKAENHEQETTEEVAPEAVETENQPSREPPTVEEPTAGIPEATEGTTSPVTAEIPAETPVEPGVTAEAPTVTEPSITEEPPIPSTPQSPAPAETAPTAPLPEGTAAPVQGIGAAEGVESVDQRIERLRDETERLDKEITDDASYERYAAVRDKLREAEFEKKYNARRMSLAERDEVLKPLDDLNAEAPEYGRWTKGDKLPGGSKVGGIFKPAGDTSGVLFRGVTLEDWNRIQQQGFIDTDGRGAISPGDEQINLAKHASTSVEYIPSGGEGVVLAIDPKGLDIFMIGADDYPRARNRIPLENIKAVSEVFKKGEGNELLAPLQTNEQNTQGQPGTQTPAEAPQTQVPVEGGQGGVEATGGGDVEPLSYSRENLQKVFTELSPEEAAATDAMVEAFSKTMGFDTTKILLKRGGTPGMGALGQFAGENAQVPQFMRDSLDTAKAMAAAGKSSEEIRAVTGWFPGKYDGKMRWEIPDEGASLKPDFGSAEKVSDLIDHPALFKAYPSIADIPVEFRGFTAGITKDGKTLVLPAMTAKFGADNSALLEGVLHEIQHLIQEKEGFAKGGTPEMVYDSEKTRIEEKKAALELARDKAKQEWDTTRTDESLKKWKDSVDAVWDVMGEKPVRLPREAEMDYYNRIAGEIEARDVQARRSLTPEQRKATEPYSSENIAPETAIVLYQSPENPRGSIEHIAESGKYLIRALTAPNFSTFIHEFGHMVHEEFLSPEGAGYVKEDADTVAQALGEDPNAGWDQWSVASKERYAKWWERYFRDGIAPSPELLDVFQRVKEFMREVYRNLTNSPISESVPPEVKAVFDRMFARTPAEEINANTPQVVPDLGEVTYPTHAVSDAERARLNMASRVKKPPQTGEDMWAKVLQTEDEWHRAGKEGTAGSALLNERLMNPDRTMSAFDQVLILHELGLRRNRVDDLARTAARMPKDATPEARNDAYAAMEKARMEYTEAWDLNDAIGTEAGRALKARQFGVNRDLSFTTQYNLQLAAENRYGHRMDKLPQEVTDKIQKLTDRIKSLQDEVASMRENESDLMQQVKALTEEVGKRTVDKVAAARKALAGKVDESAKWLRENGWLKAGDVLMQRGEGAGDKEYMDAVNRGDMETAQRMVDEAAKAAGYDEKVYHGTRSPSIGVVDFDKSQEGFHVGTKDAALEVAKSLPDKMRRHGSGKIRIIPVAIRGRFLEVKDSGAGYLVDWVAAAEDSLGETGPWEDDPFSASAEDFSAWLKSKGYSGLRYENEQEDIGSVSYAVFDRSAVKDTSPVTYDANGNIIPLSQRFNTQSPSILYQSPEIPAEALQHIATIVAAQMAKSASFDLNAFLSRQFAPEVAGHADAIREAAQAVYNSAASGEPTINDVVTDAVSPDLATIRKAARAVIAGGKTGLDVMPEVHKALKEKFPDLDYDQMVVDFTGYGKVLEPKDRPAIEAQRNLVEQMERELLKQASIEKGENPKRSNARPQAETSPELVMMARETARKLRKARLDGTLPLELTEGDSTSLLESAKTRIRNAIDLMRYAREIGKPIERTPSTRFETDKDLQDLQAEQAKEKELYDAMFKKDISDEDKAILIGRTLDTQIKEEEQALLDGLAKGPGEPREADTDENLRKRRRLSELRAARRALWEIQHPEDSALRDAERKADAKLSALRRIIAGEQTRTPGEKVPFAPSEELWATWTAIDALKDQADELKKVRKDSPEAIQAAIDRDVKANEKVIASLEQRLKDNVLVKPEKELTAAQIAKRDSEALKAQRDTISALNKELKRRAMEAGVGPYSLAAKTERRLKAVRRRIDELNRRIREKDFSTKKKEVTEDTPEMVRLRVEEMMAKQELNQMRIDTLKKNEPLNDKILRVGKNILMTHKLLKLGGDFGAWFRQLGSSIAIATVDDIQQFFTGQQKINEGKLAKYLKGGVDSFLHDMSEHKYYDWLKRREGAKYDRMTGTSFPGPFDETIDLDIPRENLIEKMHWGVMPLLALGGMALAGWPSIPVAVLTTIAAGFSKEMLIRLDRAQRVVTNMVRADMQDNLVTAGLEAGPMTAKDFRRIGKLVNVETGYGDIAKINAALPVLQYGLNAPRFYMSRLQSLWNLLMAASGIGYLTAPNKHLQKEINKLYVKSVLGRAVYYAMMIALVGKADDKDKKKKGIVLNPYSTDFGKVRLSDGVTLDFMSGLNSFVTLLARLGKQRMTITDPRTGREKTIPLGSGYGHSAWDVLGNFVASKSNMTTALMWSVGISGTYFGGRPVSTGSDPASFMKDSGNLLKEATSMIMLNDIKRIYDELGPVRGSAVVALMWGGMSANTSMTEEEKAKNKAALREYHRMLEEKEREMNQ